MRCFIALSTILSSLPLMASADQFQLEVTSSPLVEWSQEGVAKVVAQMNSIMLDTSNGGVVCDTAGFALNGFSTGQFPDSIDTQEQLRELLLAPGNNVFVVEELNYCGRFMPTAVGCAGAGTNLVVENLGLSSARRIKKNAIVWTHEFGHSQGLSRAISPPGTAHSDVPNALMYPSVGMKHTVVSSEECGHLSDANARFSQGAPVVIAQADQEELTGTSSEDDLLEFLDGIWVHGIPFSEIRSFTERVAEVRSVLVNGELSDLWPNAVISLGVIGAESDIDFLIWFFESQIPNDGSKEVERARAQVPIAIGLLSGKHGSQKGSGFLARLLEPQAAENQEVFPIEDERDLLIANQIGKNAAVGLLLVPNDGVQAFGASDEIVAAINALGGEGNTEFYDQLIGIGEEIRELGAERYFSSE